ncbi:MAG: hypothetical protein RLZZ214_1363 [Verrucomicrobiota bacterium]
MARSTSPENMKALIRLTYFALVYGFLFAAAPGDEESSFDPDFPWAEVLSPAAQTHSVPEPGSIGLVAFLVVLLALQRQRDH